MAMIIPVTETVTITPEDKDMAQRLFKIWSKKLQVTNIAGELARARTDGYEVGYKAGYKDALEGKMIP